MFFIATPLSLVLTSSSATARSDESRTPTADVMPVTGQWAALSKVLDALIEARMRKAKWEVEVHRHTYQADIK